MTIIKPCTCKSKDQDEMYGSNYRVFNYHPNARSNIIKCKCTVCGMKREFVKPK